MLKRGHWANENATAMAEPQAATGSDPMAGMLSAGESLVTDIFCIEHRYQTEEDLAAEAGGAHKKRKGRLGRLTYEFKTADVLNENRRIYPSSVFRVAADLLAARVIRGVVMGRLDHPSEWDPDTLIVKIGDAAVKLVEVKMTSDTDVKVVLDILANSYGQQLVSVLDGGGNPGISQRGVARFREPTQEERKQHGLPDGVYAVVAEALRLITYDVVGEPGFTGATDPRISESKAPTPSANSPDPTQQDPGASEMVTSLQELQTKFPAVYTEAINACKAADAATVQGRIDTAVSAAIEARKPQIVADALKPVNDQLAAETAKLAKATEAAKAAKPVLEALGVVNEKITDTEAASRLATSEAKVADLEQKFAAEKAAHETLKAKVTTFENQNAINQNLKLVSDACKQHPMHDAILRMVAAKNEPDPTKAMQAARESAAFLESIVPGGNPMVAGAVGAMNGGQGANLNGLNTQPTVSALDSLLHGSQANPMMGSGGGGGQGQGSFGGRFTGLSAEQLGVASLITSGPGGGLGF